MKFFAIFVVFAALANDEGEVVVVRMNVLIGTCDNGMNVLILLIYRLFLFNFNVDFSSFVSNVLKTYVSLNQEKIVRRIFADERMSYF